MESRKGSSLVDTKKRNHVLIKQEIFRRKPAMRTEIAEDLGLTLPTITTTVKAMIEEGLVEEYAVTDEKKVAAGRKPVAIRFRADAGYAAGIELGPYTITAVLMDLAGNILGRAELPKASAYYQEMLDQIEEILLKVCEEAGVHQGHLLGVGIGLPGFIDSAHGVIRSNPREDWTGRDLAGDFAQRCGLPVVIDNNVRLRTLGISLGSEEQGSDSFAYLFVSRGVACPLVFGDESLTGASAGAGELGQTILLTDAEDGRIEAKTVDELAGELAIFMKCQEYLLAGQAPELQKRLNEEGRISTRMLLDLEKDGDPVVQGILTSASTYLGMALANVVNLINPGLVLVDGHLLANEENRKALEETARRAFYGLNEEEVAIRFLPYDRYRGAEGAALGAIKAFFVEK